MNARTREGFYSLWTIAILICLAVCVFVLIYFSVVGGGEAAQTVPPADDIQTAEGGEAVPAEGQDPNAAPADGAVPDAAALDQAAQDQAAPQEVTPEPLPVQSNGPTVLAETADMGQDYQSRLVFLGDSTTYGLYTYGVLPQEQVWVPANGTLSLFNWALESVQYCAPGDSQNVQSLSIADAAAARQPDYLIITLGVNGVAILDESSFKDYYVGLCQAIQAASPNTRIICDSIFPVIDGQAPEGITNDMIDSANGWIQDVASQLGLRYLSSRDALVDGSGGLIEEFCAGDGLHLNPDGYNMLMNYVRTHGYQ